MSNFQNLVSKRRSIRKYKDIKLSPEHVELIIKAALKSPTSKNNRGWNFILIEDKEQLSKLSQCKKVASKFIADSALSIVVVGDPIVGDAWVEDASIASIIIQLQVEDLGLGSCWVQVKERETASGESSEQYIKDLLDIPMHMRVVSVISIGHKETAKEPIDDENLLWEKVHIGKFEVK